MMLIMISKVHVANDFDYCVYVADDGHLARSFGYKGAPPKKLKMILKNFHTFINVFLDMVMMNDVISHTRRWPKLMETNLFD